MGKLAERLSDARRSGVYRIEATDALEEAVALNSFALARISLAGAGALGRIDVDALAPRADGAVLLFSGFEALLRAAPDALDGLVSKLEAVAFGKRERGQRFFAAFVDPSTLLPLAPLYNWQRKKSKEETHGTDEARAA